MTDEREPDWRVKDRLRHRTPPTREPEWRQREAQFRRAGRAILFDFQPLVNGGLDYWRDGGYPSNFLPFAYKTLGVTDPELVLHMCSGGVQVGITVDIRPEVKPKIVADARHIPLPDASVRWVMADPPYAESYAEQLYGTGNVYPRPRQLLIEAARLLAPMGRVGLLHYIVPRSPKGLRFVGAWGLFMGADMAIRAWSVYERDQDGLWPVEKEASDGDRQETANG